MAKGTVTAVLVPLVLGLVVEPLLLPPLSVPPIPAIWLSGLPLAAAGLALTRVR